ncbi:MAG: Rrf2 family transcriptional regulator [Gemmatimonadetes bacterium]|nr:MAG: Rrf2 family transcriptional regulator [Gemmatimonadota bacterium]
MKFSTQEEYGLRCLLHIAKQGCGGSQTISEISEAEGLSSHYVAKLMRILRQGGFVASVRGQAGGYELARAADQIRVSEVITVLGGKFFDDDFCERHAGAEECCIHLDVACSLRGLWFRVQTAVDQVLSQTTLQDLITPESSGGSPLINMGDSGVLESQIYLGHAT